jgi:hypothetical protein
LRVASWKFLNRLRWMDSITVRNSRGINGRFTRSRLHSGHHRGQHGSSSRQIKRDHLRRLIGLEPERGLLPSGRPLTPGVRSALAWLKGVRPGSERGLSRPSRRSRTELILSRNAPSRPAGCSSRAPRAADPGDRSWQYRAAMDLEPRLDSPRAHARTGRLPPL